MRFKTFINEVTRKPEHTHAVTRGGNVVSYHTSSKSAHKKADSLDNKYGATVHSVKLLESPISEMIPYALSAANANAEHARQRKAKEEEKRKAKEQLDKDSEDTGNPFANWKSPVKEENKKRQVEPPPEAMPSDTRVIKTRKNTEKRTTGSFNKFGNFTPGMKEEVEQIEESKKTTHTVRIEYGPLAHQSRYYDVSAKDDSSAKKKAIKQHRMYYPYDSEFMLKKNAYIDKRHQKEEVELDEGLVSAIKRAFTPKPKTPDQAISDFRKKTKERTQQNLGPAAKRKPKHYTTPFKDVGKKPESRSEYTANREMTKENYAIAAKTPQTFSTFRGGIKGKGTGTRRTHTNKVADHVKVYKESTND